MEKHRGHQLLEETASLRANAGCPDASASASVWAEYHRRRQHQRGIGWRCSAAVVVAEGVAR
jgi:hypothetical protein